MGWAGAFTSGTVERTQGERARARGEALLLLAVLERAEMKEALPGPAGSSLALESCRDGAERRLELSRSLLDQLTREPWQEQEAAQVS